MLSIQIFPVLFMPFNLHLGLVLTYFGSVWKFSKACFHKFGKILMPFLSFCILLNFLINFLLLLLDSLFISRDHICIFLSIVYLWFWRVNNFFVIIVFKWLGRMGSILILMFWMPFLSMKMKRLRPCWMEL